MRLTTLMGRTTASAVGVVTASLLLPCNGPAVLFAGPAGAAARQAAPKGAIEGAPSAVKVTAVAGGLYHTWAVTSNGTAYAWGWNITGQLCNGNTTGSDVPQKVSLLDGRRVTGIAAGFAHSLALTSTGAVFACGKNDGGELGDGNTTDSDRPMKVLLPAGTRVTAVAASEHDLAVTSTGSVLAWGTDLYGELGGGSTSNSDVPVNVQLPAGTKVTAVAAGSLHSLALTSTGSVLAWGFNADGELGNGTTVNSDVPVEVKLPVGVKVTAIAAGGFDSLALTSTGAVYAWGYNADGELGDASTANSTVPVRVKLPGGMRVKAIAAGGPVLEVGSYVAGPAHALALTSTGAVYAWGHNADGELGDASTANSTVPVRVKLPRGMRVKAIAAGEAQSLAVTSAGGLLAWGGNNFGQLGDGAYKGSDVPVTVKLQGAARKVRKVMATTSRSAQREAAAAPPTITQSTTFAGYNFANYIGVPGAVSAIIVVPKLNCKGTPSTGSSVYAGVGIQSVNSEARLYLGCTPRGRAQYYPSLFVNGATRNLMADLAHPGDMVEFAVSQSAAQVTVTVIDLTHKFIATANGSGSGTSEGILAGIFPGSSGATSAVPNFGTLAFSSAQTNGYPLGSATPQLQVDNLYVNSKLQVKTTYSTTNHELFATVYV